MEEDAQQALKTIKEYDGHRISLSLAKKKLKDTDKKKGMYDGTVTGKYACKVVFFHFFSIYLLSKK